MSLPVRAVCRRERTNPTSGPPPSDAALSVGRSPTLRSRRNQTTELLTPSSLPIRSQNAPHRTSRKLRSSFRVSERRRARSVAASVLLPEQQCVQLIRAQRSLPAVPIEQYLLQKGNRLRRAGFGRTRRPVQGTVEPRRSSCGAAQSSCRCAGRSRCPLRRRAGPDWSPPAFSTYAC